ncbi:MAG: formate dehydrogenase subunit delta [Oleiphilaceae bacterium]|nr:formate dehydrogenase subunit delta [Oleiphilaceae bacterium]
MSDQQLQNLIKMINQISANNLHHGDESQAADVVAGHLKKFWARSMKEQLIAYADEDGGDLAPVSRLAVQKLKA